MAETPMRDLIACALAEWEFRQKMHPKEFFSAFIHKPSDKGLERVDFALAALERVLDLPKEAAFTLFAVGRTVGWIAHAMEQAADGRLIRPRARYIGEHYEE